MPYDLRVGQQVRITNTGQTGVVEGFLSGDRILVRVGGELVVVPVYLIDEIESGRS